MIIQCEKCQTKFNLDDALLKQEGSKVRCSNCREIFVVYPQEEIEPLEQEFIGFDEGKDFEQDLSEEKEIIIKEEYSEEENGVGETGFTAEEFIDEPLSEMEREETVFLEELPDPEENNDSMSKIAEVDNISKKRSSKSYLLPVLLIIFASFVGICAAFVFFYPEMIHRHMPFLKTPEKLEITDMGIRRLSFKEVTGTFIDSREAGRLFVIRGMVKNEYPKSRSFILIKGAIFDNVGREVKNKQIYAGNIFNEDEIKELPLARINRAMEEPDGMGMKNVNVSSGTSIPFMIVFENLPENLSEFTVEAISSSQGS